MSTPQAHSAASHVSEDRNRLGFVAGVSRGRHRRRL